MKFFRESALDTSFGYLLITEGGQEFFPPPTPNSQQNLAEPEKKKNGLWEKIKANKGIIAGTLGVGAALGLGAAGAGLLGVKASGNSWLANKFKNFMTPTGMKGLPNIPDENYAANEVTKPGIEYAQKLRAMGNYKQADDVLNATNYTGQKVYNDTREQGQKIIGDTAVGRGLVSDNSGFGFGKTINKFKTAPIDRNDWKPEWLQQGLYALS